MRRLVTILALCAANGWGADCAPAQDPSRVVIAGGSLTEIIYLLGAEDRIVATDRTSNYPAAALEFPSVGYVRNLSAEGVLSLAPTLVLGEHDMGPLEVLDQLKRTGVETTVVEEVHTAQGIRDKVVCVADVLGLQGAEREAVIAGVDEQIADLDAVETQDQPVRVAVLLGIRDGMPLAAGRETSGQGLLDMAGAENVLAGFEGWKPVSLEAMSQANPDYIVMPLRGISDAGGVEKIAAHPAVALTNAGKRANIIGMDGMTILGFGPRTLGAALELADRFGTLQ